MKNIYIKMGPNTLINHFEDGSVLLNLSTEQYFTVNAVGREMLELLLQYGTTDEAFKKLLEIYEVDPQTLESDLMHFIDDLAGEGLIIMIEA